MIKMSNNFETEGIYFNIIKFINEKLTADIILNSERLESFIFKVRKKTRVPSLIISIQHFTGRSSQIHDTEKGDERHSNWKGGSKLLPITEDIILYVRNT